jgi:phosphatidate phosphatase APP1
VTGQTDVSADGHILVPPAASQFGVISDVDDTILVSGVTNLLRMARLAFLNNARTRLPFAGVAAFYRALQSGPESTLFNPVFYVSSSPWNLYDLLVDFCAVQGIPKGPFMLRDVGVDEDKFLSAPTRATRPCRSNTSCACALTCPSCSSATAASTTPKSTSRCSKTTPPASAPSTSAR